MSTSTASKAVPEERHLEAEAAIATFSYKKPEKITKSKANTLIARSSLVRAMVQVVRDGGETNLHYHSKVDGFWFVLTGKARFYGPNDEIIAECGPHEGLIIPHYARYWFEKAGDEDLEILLVQGFNEAGAPESGRTNSAPQTRTESDHFSLVEAKS